ncbi:NAD(P)H-dependent oxidoreductase [Microbacterium chocolatum]|uniref:NADPH-dependent FMN reductase n=1 Tax=Microbacterium aurantiacum TaxID=162393 RepID=UPI00338EFB32
MKVTVVAGNPKPASRTLAAAHIIAHALTGREADDAVDVVELGAGLLGWGDPAVANAVATVRTSDLVIVASPTFKATYTGILKLFLDQFDTGTGLAGITAVPLMLGAGPAHALAPELLLKPVLVELGAICPTQGLYLSDKAYDQPGVTDAWMDRWAVTVLGSASASPDTTHLTRKGL